MLVLLNFTKELLSWFQGLEINNSLTARGNKSSPVNDIFVNDKIVSDDKDISEYDFFVNIGRTLAAESTKRSSNNISTYLSNIQNNIPAYRFSNILVENFALTLKKLKEAQKGFSLHARAQSTHAITKMYASAK